MLYYTILYYTLLYYTIVFCTILYCIVAYYIVLYVTMLYYTIQYYTTENAFIHHHRPAPRIQRDSSPKRAWGEQKQRMLGEGKARPPRKKHTRQNVESSCPRNHFPSRITHLQYVDPHQPCQNRSSKAWDRWGCWKRCLGNRVVSQGPGLSLSVPVLVCVPVTVMPSPLCKENAWS